MKNNLSVLKLVLVASWLVSGFACGSQSQNSSNTSNSSIGNGNSNVSANNITTKSDKKDPKEVCAYLPEFPAGEYKSSSSDHFSCKSEKEEKLPGGKHQIWTYEAVGTAGYIKWVEFHFSSSGTDAENLKGEKRFVQTIETLWQKAFAAPLPDNIKAQILVNKGKKTMTYKKFSEPVYVTINHVAIEDKRYGLKIEIDMCDLCK